MSLERVETPSMENDSTKYSVQKVFGSKIISQEEW